MLEQQKKIEYVLFFILLLFFSGCGKDKEKTEKNSLDGRPDEIIYDSSAKHEVSPYFNLIKSLIGLSEKLSNDSVTKLIVDYPLNSSVFPPEFISPTFLWHDGNSNADIWLIKIEFDQSEKNPIYVLVPEKSPPEGDIDMEAISDTNEIYKGTEYERSAKAWTPANPLWEKIKNLSNGKNVKFTFTGFYNKSRLKALSIGNVILKISKDPVGAPLFYRDVPLMPGVGKNRKIQPIGYKAVPIIAWRLRDISRKESKLVLKGLYSCANCHSFSSDGKLLGMDMDGPDGDKGIYAVKNIEKNMVIGKKDVITWNSFPDKPEGHRTIGLFSRVSPDGKYVASTVNEDIFVVNFRNYKFLQVFYPTRGIIGIYSSQGKKFFKLPGADNPEFVQCNPVWSPDGKWIYFSRAKAFDAFPKGLTMPLKANDTNEPQIKYDIYRVPFNDGKGGKPEAVKGASNNGFSNTFPKISPDHKWLVWTRCRNGLLMRPDGKLFIVPAEGGKARKMTCNTPLMNSWHSFSPNSKWMVFSSKSRSPYTQAFLTHINEDGKDSPAILIPNCTAANRAVNLPEFLNNDYDSLNTIKAPVVDHHIYFMEAEIKMKEKKYSEAEKLFTKAIEKEPDFVRAIVNLGVLLMKIKRYEEGLVYLEEASRLSPSDPYALYNGYVGYLKTGRPYMAKKAIDSLLEIQPGYPNAENDNAYIAKAVSKLNKEIIKTEKSLLKNKNSIGLKRYLAELYQQSGRLEDFVNMMEEIRHLSDDNPVILCNLGWFLATNPDDKIRDGKRAVELGEKAVSKTGGRRPEPLDVLAAAYAEVGNFEKSLAIYKKAMALAEKSNPGLLKALLRRKARVEKGKPIRTPRDR